MVVSLFFSYRGSVYEIRKIDGVYRIYWDGNLIKTLATLDDCWQWIQDDKKDVWHD